MHTVSFPAPPPPSSAGESLLTSSGNRKASSSGNSSGGVRVYADLGASVLTGVLGNPLAVVARQAGAALHKVRDSCPLYRPDGLPASEAADKTAEARFNLMLDLAGERVREGECVRE